MRSEDGWTCMCGHEIDQDTQCCMVWDRRGKLHLIPENESHCPCCGWHIFVLDHRFQRDGGHAV